MIILGLTGSIGMGKTTTAKMFADEGVPVHDADAAVHALYEGAAVAPIEAAFPGTTHHGKVDREKLGRQVVGDHAAHRDGGGRVILSRPLPAGSRLGVRVSTSTFFAFIRPLIVG